MAEKKQLGESFEEKSLALLKKDEEKLKRRIERIFETTQDFNRQITEDFGEIGKSIAELKEKSGAWHKELQKYFVKDYEERRPSEINRIDDYREKIQRLQNDISLILGGLEGHERYNSPFVELEETVKKLRINLDEQEKLTKKEAKKRKKAEEESDIEEENVIKQRELKTRIKKLENNVEKLIEANEEFKGHINSLFNHDFRIYMLKEISKFGIPGINFEYKDEGIEYVLSREFNELTEKKDFKKIIDAKGKVKDAKLTDIMLSDQYEKLIEKISMYARDHNHIRNLRKLWKDFSEAKRTLNLRKRKDLVWCGDYSKDCAFICPGFISSETYCPEDKNLPYDERRSSLWSKLMDEVYIDMRIIIGFENKISKWERTQKKRF